MKTTTIMWFVDKEANIEDLTKEHFSETEENIDKDFLNNQGLSQD